MSCSEHRNVHSLLAASSPSGSPTITSTCCPVTASGGICVVSRIDCSHHTGKTRLADACKWVSNFWLLLSLPSLVFIVPVSHVSLQVSRAEIGSSAPIVSIPTTTLGAEKNIAKSSLFNSGHFVSTPWAHPLLLLSAAKTENMLAWNHSAVDQDWFQALVAAVDHRVHDLLANQVHLVVPVKSKHGSRVAPIYGGESRSFHLTYVSFHVILR